MDSTSKAVVIGVICIAVGAIGGFYGRGISSPTRNATIQSPVQTQRPSVLPSKITNRPIIGIVRSVKAEVMTVEKTDGTSGTILLNDKTTFNKITSASVKDFPTGSQILIVGEQGADGSIAANTIQTAPTATPTPIPSVVK